MSNHAVESCQLTCMIVDSESTHFITGIFASCSLFTISFGGTPTAQTKSAALFLMMTSVSSGSWPFV